MELSIEQMHTMKKIPPKWMVKVLEVCDKTVLNGRPVNIWKMILKFLQSFKRIFQTQTSEIGLWLVDKPSIALAIWTRRRLSFMFSSSSEEELADCTLLSLFCSSSMAFWCCCILSEMLKLGGVFSSDVEHMWKQYGGLLVDGSALVVDK